jgi:hypothetical protein
MSMWFVNWSSEINLDLFWKQVFSYKESIERWGKEALLKGKATVDLLILPSIDQLLFKSKVLFTFYTK